MIIEQIASYLDELGIGVYDTIGVSGNIFLEHLPDNPDIAIALYSSGGSPADSKLNYDLVAVQIMVRGGLDATQAQSLAQGIYDEIHGFEGALFVGGGDWIVSCLGIQSHPVLLGKDANGRFEYSLNFDIEFQNNDSRRRE